MKITEIVDALKKKYDDLNETEVDVVVQEALLQLENLDLFNDNTIAIILATPDAPELMQKFQAILNWIETKPFIQIGLKNQEELQEIYKTKIAPECKNKCFELIWNHPDDVPSLSRGIAALYKLKTFRDDSIDTFQMSYLTLLGKYPNGALEIGNYLFQIGNLMHCFHAGNGKYLIVDQDYVVVDQGYVDNRRLELEITLSKADEETQDGIFHCLSFHRGQNTHYKINQNYLRYAKSLGAALRSLMKDGRKELKDQIFDNYDFRIMNNLVHQFPKYAAILMDEVVAYMSLKKQTEETKGARLEQMKMFFASLQEKLILNRFNPKSENIENLVSELERLFKVDVADFFETQKNSFSSSLKKFQEELLKAGGVGSLTKLCIHYIAFFNCQNSNKKLDLNQLPDELKQHFVPVTESKKTP